MMLKPANTGKPISSLDSILKPQLIAVIGASASEGKWGHAILKGIIEGGYRGEIYPINPKGGEILGLPAYPTILEVKKPIDFAVIGIKASLVPQRIAECRESGVKSVMIVSGGFSEAGEEGKTLQEQIIQTAGDMRIVGPNTVGIINLNHNLNVSYLRPLKGPLALICQGGNVFNEVEYIAHSKGVGFTYLVDPSNQADVSICDFLEYIRLDPDTKVILMYIEGFKCGEGSRFIKLAKEITKTKPIVAIKTGVTAEGARAARSHTSSLAGKEAIYSAAFKQAGVIRVKNPQELVDVAEVFVKLPHMKGNRIGLLVDGGSHATMACDAISQYGLKLSSLSSETQSILRDILLPHSSVSNPVDFAGAMDADVRVLPKAAEVLLKDERVEALLIAGINFGGYSRWFGVADLEIEAARELNGMLQKYSKPIIFHNTVLSENTPALEIIRSMGIPVFYDVEKAAKCLASLASHGMYSQKNTGRALQPEPVKKNKEVGELIQRAKTAGRANLFESEAKEVLKECGLPVAEFRVARSRDGAIMASREIGYPVAEKIMSAQIIHKSDIGGVVLIA